MPKVFISHSSKDDFATAVRDEVYKRLQAVPGIEPLLDVQCLEPSAEWRPKLLHWLGQCHGAVILFSRDALASQWVFTEATILSWRRALNPKLRLVPVLLGDVQGCETQFEAFTPVRLQEIQFIKPASIAEDAQTLASRIVACFQDFTYNDPDPELNKWSEDVQVCMKQSDPLHLERAAQVLGICQPYWVEFGKDILPNLSYQLLHAKLDVAYEAIREAMESIYLPDNRRKLIEKVIPIWVKLAAARNIMPVLQAADYRMRNLALNTVRHDTAVHYLQRATCCTNKLKIINASEITGASPQEMLFQFETALIRGAGYTKLNNVSREKVIERIISEAQRSQNFWVVLFGEAAIRQGLPTLLRDKYRNITFLLLTGPEFLPQVSTQLPALELIEPRLEADEEQDAIFRTEDLRNLIDSFST